MKFNKTICNELANDIALEVAGFMVKKGFNIKRAGGKFSDYEFTAKFIITPIMSAEEEANTEKAEFLRNAPFFGVKNEAYKSQFTNKGDRYEFIGFKPSRRKFAYLARNLKSGKLLLFSETLAKQEGWFIK